MGHEKVARVRSTA